VIASSLAACRLAFRKVRRDDMVVLGSRPGVVPTACEAATALDVFVVRKLGVPGHDEPAMASEAKKRRRLGTGGALSAAAPDGKRVCAGQGNAA
jgi:predicted phosphoribosyltransferase